MRPTAIKREAERICGHTAEKPEIAQTARAYPWLEPDATGRFFVGARAVGKYAPQVFSWAEHRGFPCAFDEDAGAASFPIRCSRNALEDFPKAEIYRCTYAVEEHEGTFALREVDAHIIIADETT